AAPAEPYEDLTLIGLVCLADPLRADVRAAIEACRNAGIGVVMCTGDHAATAAAIAGEAGIAGPDVQAIDGTELASFDPAAATEAQGERLRAARVFARVPPAAKLSLVALHQKAGEVVAMTGDGVNDAPALRKADIGIAMGRRGTQVAREASDVVLLDDAFSTIVEAVAQGRVIFENIRKFVVYLMSCNVSEVLVVGLAVGAGLPVPLLPLQILFLNLVTDVFPAFALGLGEGDGAVLDGPPRDPSEAVVDRARWIWIAVMGGAIALSTLAAFAASLFALDLPAEAAVTVAFLSISLAQLWNVFNVRDPRSGLFVNDVSRNRYVWFALVLCLGLISAAVLAPGLSEVLRLPYPGWAGLAVALGSSLLPLVLGQALLMARNGRSEAEAGTPASHS
ncbi:MAG: HAD-IC family P-type ATPase, partial [Pseudomonadota bacterium]